MARKFETLTISEEGRDKGKVFILTEMPATTAKKWLMKLYAKAGAGITDAQTLALLDEPELEAWRDCVKYQHNPKHVAQTIFWDRPECQIEEIQTVGFLQGKVLEMHTSFFPPVSPSTTG